MNWNIEKSVKLEGKTDDFSIKKQESVIIGNNKKYVVDIIMKTSFNKGDFFIIMKEMLLNRFVLYNPAEETEKSKNKKRFSNKKLITYVLILEKNEYEEFNWDWDKCADMKEIVKESLEKYFSSFHKELFYYCNKVCKNWNTDEKLKNIKTSPFSYITKKLNESKKNPSYIVRFIDNLADNYKTDREEIKRIISNEDLFIERIENFLKIAVDGFFDEEEFVF